MAPSRLLHALAAASALVIGCGPPQSVSNAPEHYDIGSLEEVGQLYLSAFNARRKPPTSTKDFPRGDLLVGGMNAIKKGEVVVYWGVEPTPSQASDEIVAYKAEVPEKGGYVLLRDMNIRAMSADEFKAAPKPPGPTSADAPAKKAG